MNCYEHEILAALTQTGASVIESVIRPPDSLRKMFFKMKTPQTCL
jgi:hypothetical protein